MNDADFKKAKNFLNAYGKDKTILFLKSINSDIRQFADMLFNNNEINKDVWAKLVGEPMPDLEKENAFREFKNRLQNGNVTFNELQMSYADERYGQAIRNYIQTRVQQLTLSEYELKEYFKRGLLDEAKTKEYCQRAGLNFEQIENKPVPPVNIPSHVWPTDPSLTYGSTDVLLIGAPSAGKTMMLASLYHHGKNSEGNLSPDANNNGGYAYSSILMSAIDQGQFIAQTPPDTILHTTVDISTTVIKKNWRGEKYEERVVCPFNFIEMPGETYLRSFGKDFDSLPENLKICLEQSKNPKIVLFTIPVKERYVEIGEDINKMKILAVDLYAFILDLFIAKGIMDRIVAVGLIITKWDENESTTDEAFNKLIEEKCKSLNTKLNELHEDEEIVYEPFPFCVSLQVDSERNTYKFNNSYIKEIYSWILECAPIR